MSPQAVSPEAASLSREEEQAEVIRRLEEDIIFGRFAPGARLVEDTLMAATAPAGISCARRCSSWSGRASCCAKRTSAPPCGSIPAEEVRQIYEVREMLTRQAALMIALPAPA